MDQGDGIQYDSLLNMLGNGLVSEGRSSEPDDVMAGKPYAGLLASKPPAGRKEFQ